MATKRSPTTWKPGQSGNPRGRPPGGGEVGALRAKIAEHLPDVLAAVIAKAREGDMQAARLLIERTLPPIRAAESAVALDLPPGTLTDQGRAILSAVAAGTLPPGQGAQLVAALASLARVAELDELERRLGALEAAHDQAH